jgi:GAF domain-containing protein
MILVRYQQLFEVFHKLTSILDMSTLLRQAVEVASELTGAQDASIFLYDHNNQELYFKVATNPNKQRVQKLNLLTDNNIAGWIIKNRQPVILANDWHKNWLDGPIQSVELPPSTSLLGVPLLSADKVVGAIEVINKLTKNFDEEDLEILAIFGAQVGVLIDNARLFQQSDLILDLVHEIRTPLASLNSAAHLLKRADITEEQHHYFIKIIQEEIQRLSGMAPIS